MTLEQFPIVLGVLVALIGLGLVLDARLPDYILVRKERRRRPRTERDLKGELLVGVGLFFMAAALIGRDTWRFGTLCVIIGSALIIGGAWRNQAFIREGIFFRGPKRRGKGGVGG
jgi:hypothetical protein